MQKQVDKVAELGKSAAFSIPTVLWDGAVKVTRAATTKGSAGQKLDAALDASKDAADDVKDAAETTADAVASKTNSSARSGSATPRAKKASDSAS